MHKISMYIITLAAMTMSTQALAVGASGDREALAPQDSGVTLRTQGGQIKTPKIVEEAHAVANKDSRRSPGHSLSKQTPIDPPSKLPTHWPRIFENEHGKHRNPVKREHRLKKHSPGPCC